VCKPRMIFECALKVIHQIAEFSKGLMLSFDGMVKCDI